MGEHIYRRTSAGRTAFLFDSSLSMEHRLLLAVLEVERHSAHFRYLLPSYSETSVMQWLAELGEQGLVQAVPPAA
jgi:hypothetical protein